MNFTVTAFPGQNFSGTVAAVEPAGATSSNVVTYIVLISVDPTNVQLLPDMTATLTIITQSGDNTTLVANSALTWAPAGARAQANHVYVMRNGAPVPVAIQTGITDGVTTQVVSGLQSGDQVITGSAGASKSASSPSSSPSSAGSRSILPAAVPKPGG